MSRKEIKMSVNQKSDENIINNIFKIILYILLKQKSIEGKHYILNLKRKYKKQKKEHKIETEYDIYTHYIIYMTMGKR